MIDVVGRQSLDPEQMAVRERGLGGASLHEFGTIGGVLSHGNTDAGTPGSMAGPFTDTQIVARANIIRISNLDPNFAVDFRTHI